MGYEIDAQGKVSLGKQKVSVPSTISAEAQEYLRRPPWDDTPMPEGPSAMWHARSFVDAALAQLNDVARQMYPVEIVETEIAGVRCHVVRPRDLTEENARRVLINLHGGGFVLGSGSLVEAIPIANLTGVPVVAVDYRLAPEHPFPAAVDDAVAVYRSFLDQGYQSSSIGLFGSSAGGFLTAQTAVRLEREGLPLPACLGVFTAGGDFRSLGDTAQIFTLSGFWGELILPVDHELSEIRAYLGGADPSDPLVSPINADLSRFPPTLLMSGTRDAVLSATTSFHRALRRHGVDADLFVFEAMPHSHWYTLHLPEAREALDIMSNFFCTVLDAAEP